MAVFPDAFTYEVPECGLLFIVFGGFAVMRGFPTFKVVQQEQKIRNVAMFVVAQVREVVRLGVHQVQKLGPGV